MLDGMSSLSIPRRDRTWLDAAGSRVAAMAMADDQFGVVSRGQLVRAGVPRWFVRRELCARRWRRTGRQTVAVHCGPLPVEALRWVAVLEVSPRAALDGLSALLQAGLDSELEDEINVVVPRGARPRRVPGVRVRESRRFREKDVMTAGIRRMRPAVAAANAARWARSERQGQLFLMQCVQQRLAPAPQVVAALERLPRSRRRSALLQLGQDLVGGVHSLGELDIAQDFRRRGLPEVDRQVVRQRASGTEYLDCELAAYDLVLEIDGAGHASPLQRLSDLLRDLTETAGGKTVIRIPLDIYRIDRERVLDHLEQLLVARGWVRAESAA
ncbi:MAG: hypothetical protein QOE99_2050 [Actinomycetota bacterium]|jgi:very-short-patch-repair endonuclease|nr:hypothetical protein [Actinomycetota bacterium]